MRINDEIKIGATSTTLSNLVKATRIYNGDGSPGWYKIAHSGGTSGWSENCFVLIVTSGTGINQCAMLLIEYYNNDSFQFRKLLGNISLNNLKAIKNTDNSLDIYVKAENWYQPIFVQLLSWYGNTNTYPIQVEWIGSSLPSGGTQYSFTDI